MKSLKLFGILSSVTIIGGVSTIAVLATSCGPNKTDYTNFSADLGTIADWNPSNNQLSHVLPAADYTKAPYANYHEDEKMIKNFSSSYTSANFINAFMWVQSSIYQYSVSEGNIYFYNDCNCSAEFKNGLLVALNLVESRMWIETDKSQHFVYEKISLLHPVAITGIELHDSEDISSSYKLQMGTTSMAFHVYYATENEITDQDVAQILWSINKWDIANIVLPTT